MAKKDYDIMNCTVEDIKRNFNDYTWTFYGEAGFGKSQICGFLFDDPAFWLWEQGANAIKAKKVPVADWAMAKSHLKALQKAYEQGKPMPFKTAIMDTGDIAWKHCVAWVCRQNGWSHPSEGEWGAGWDAVKTEWDMFMGALQNIGIQPIFICHDKDKEFKPRGAEKYHKVVPSVPASAMGTIVDGVDFCVYCTIVKEKDENDVESEVRRMYFRGTSEFVAKSRLTYMPNYIDYADTSKKASILVKQAFEKAIVDEFGEADSEGDDVYDTAPVIIDSTGTNDNDGGKPTKTKKDKSTKKADDDTKGNTPNEMSLDDLKAELNKLSMKLFKAKVLTSQDIISVIKDKTGFDKVSDIDDIEKARALYTDLSSR